MFIQTDKLYTLSKCQIKLILQLHFFLSQSYQVVEVIELFCVSQVVFN